MSRLSSSNAVERVLRSVGGHAGTTWLLTGALALLAGVTLGLASLLAVDYCLVLPGWGRLMLLVAWAAMLAALLRWTARQRPSHSAEDLALLVEHRHGALNNVMINALQLRRQAIEDDETVRMVEQIAEEAREAASGIQPSRVVSKRRLGAASAASLIGFLVLGGLLVGFGAEFARGLNRVLLPLADNTYTQIVEVSPGDQDVTVNASVAVTARIAGRVPSQAVLECETLDGQRIDLPLTPRSAEQPDRLTATVTELQQAMRYRVVAGDDRSAYYELRVHEPPTVERIVQTITPPAYLSSGATEQTGGTVRALAGSTVALAVHSTQALREAWITIDQQPRQAMALREAATTDGAATTVAAFTMPIEKPARYTVELISSYGFASPPMSYDVQPMIDDPPSVRIVEPGGDVVTTIDAQVALELRATDNHAIDRLELVREPAERGEGEASKAVVLKTWSASADEARTASGRFVAPVAELGLAEGAPVVLRARAFDRRPGAAAGISETVVIRLPERAEAEDAKALTPEEISLTQLIEAQRTNIRAAEAVLGGGSPDLLVEQVERQQEIRVDARAIIDSATEAQQLNPLLRRLEDLAETLMVLAVEQLDRARQGSDAAMLRSALSTEYSILEQLRAAASSQQSELAEASNRRIAEALAELISRQKGVRSDTAGKSSSAAALASRQLVLSRDVVALAQQVRLESETGASGSPERAAVLGQVAEAFEQRGIRTNMLIAAEALGEAAHDAAIAKQDQALADLRAIEKMLLKEAVDRAQALAEKSIEPMKEAKQRLDRVVQLQEAVVEVAKQLKKMKDLTGGKETNPQMMQDLVWAEQDVKDIVEELVQDMHLLPDAVASNDLLPEMNEIFEDVTQAAGSEDDPVSEIAVDRDEGTLKQLKAMQEKMEERMADLEMWLENKPDTAIWNQESFDKDELGEIPLGDLPDALEDIVGDLLEQAEDLRQEATDSTSNVGFPDGEFGWSIADGPMPSWAAKGKSGNTKPNENEMTGRSGSGRQGMSSGEIVGDTIKSLEGSDIKTRRTDEGFQAGELKEEEAGALEAKATGGGKMAGATYKQGMSGDAPPRDELKYRDLARKARELKDKTQSTYSKAKMLRLPTGELERAALELDAATRRLESGDIEGFVQGAERVVRAIDRTQGLLAGKTLVQGAEESQRDPAAAGATREPIPKQYEDRVAEYLRNLARN